MSKIFSKAYFGEKIVDIENANLSVASSAVLYGLSVYTVFPIIKSDKGLAAFRLKDHYNRLINSSKIIGIDDFSLKYSFDNFQKIIADLVKENNINENVFVRATIHVSELIPGTRSRNLETKLSIFVYEANPIIKQDGARIKTSLWRRTPDFSIPSRAKVNGAYVNSVLGKQDAIDSGYDDCLFLDSNGHVCELSAANIFIVRNGALITPSVSNDILEGINRDTILKIAKELGIPCEERNVDLTELYIADEVFACGTSSFVAPIIEVDSRFIGNGSIGEVTQKIKSEFKSVFEGENNSDFLDYIC